MDLQICIVRTTTLWEKRETFCDEKKAQKSHFPKRGNPCFWSKKCQFFLHLISVKTRLVVVLLNDFLEKKETFLSISKNNFSKSKKLPFFFQGVNPCSWPKNANFILNLNLIKISLEIMLSDFAEKRETFLTIKNRIFQSPKDRIFFQTGRTHAFGQKMPFFSLLDLIKITLQIMLSDFAEKKETFFDLKKQHFSKSIKSLFFQRG